MVLRAAVWLALGVGAMSCAGAQRPVVTGPEYAVSVVSWNGHPVAPGTGGKLDLCTLRAGDDRGRVSLADPGSARGPVPVLTAHESELMEGLALDCDAWSPSARTWHPPGPRYRVRPIPDAPGRRIYTRKISGHELAAGRAVVDGTIPTIGGAWERFRVELRLVPVHGRGGSP